MPDIKQFFTVDKQRKSPQKSMKRHAIELLDSSDDDDLDIIGVKAVSRAKTATKAAKATKINNSNVKSESNVQQKEEESPKTAASILGSISSIDLSEVETGAKPSFRQIMELQASRSQNGNVTDIEAAPNCLMGLNFVVTGQLPTLGRDEIQSLIKRYGGHVTSSISGKTSCLVLGEDAGPSKIQKAKSLKLKVIDEQGFVQLLQSMPANGGSGAAAEKERARRARESHLIETEAKRLKQISGSLPAGSNKEEKSRSAPNPKLSHTVMWTTKYAPYQMSDICGNNAAVQRLSKWLQNWRAARQGTFKGEGSDFRAAMLSGPPGIGKTTAAHLIGELQGFDVVEYNASDTRSKSLLQSQVSQTLQNSTLALPTASVQSKSGHTRKMMVIMDEVDGMSAGDRGGVGAMAALARTTNVPLILICNERTLPKMRPFDRCVFDIPFRRPEASQVRHRLMSIAQAEGLELDSSSIEQLVAATRSDIRQMLNLLETYRTTKKKMSYDVSRQFSQSWNKEIVLKPFDIASRLLSRGSQSSMTTNERLELYFHDYDFAPLMIQENYLNTSPNLNASAEAAQSISDADLVDRRIHGPQQQWSLMPLHALFSCVRPSFAAAGQARGRFNFTSYLGNNSKGAKYKRLLAELRSHIRLKLAANAVDLRLEFQPVLAFMLLDPLLNRGSDAIPEVIEFMDKYFITKEDWDVVMELGVGIDGRNTENMAKKLPTAVKTAFTRKYNAMSHPLPFMKSIDSKAAAVTGRKPEVPDIDDVIVEDLEPEDPEPRGGEEDLESAVKNDKYIKAKPKPKVSKAKTAPKAATKPKAAPKSRAKSRPA